MPPTPSTASRTTARTVLRTAAVLGAGLGLLLGSSAPASSAQTPGSTVYNIAWTFEGGVQTSSGGLSAKSYATLDDLLASDQNDRARAKPDNGESVSIESAACVPGNYTSSAVTLYGENPNWFNLATDSTGTVQKTRVSLMCKRSNGTQHRYRWGYATGSTDCVQLTRAGQVLSLTATAGCIVERHVISSNGKATQKANPDLHFSSSITLLSTQ